MPRLLSLDPGETTGVAILSFEPDKSPTVILHKQITGGLEGFIDWFGSFPVGYYDEIICESFILRPGVHGANIEPAYVIGALQAMAKVPITYQPPSQKKLAPDAVLKLGKDFYLTARPHATDAIRHGIIYLRNRKHLPTLKRFWPGE